MNQVLNDLVKACDPVWAVVKGDFRPRGGISTTIEARWPRPGLARFRLWRSGLRWFRLGMRSPVHPYLRAGRDD